MSNKIAVKHLGHDAAMIGGSKSNYRSMRPDNVAVFNAQICVEEKGVVKTIWNGDIDVTLSRESLKALASELKTAVHVMYESEGFNTKGKINLANFVYRVTPEGGESLGNSVSSYKLA